MSVGMRSLFGAHTAPVDTPKAGRQLQLTTDFMKAGFAEIALLREWASPVGYAIQNTYPV
jgi:hypothetical protein